MTARTRPPREPAPDQDGVTDAVESSIWDRPERAARGPRPTHTRDEITAVAVGIADREGLDAVSMRRVAGELGAGTTSLYRYFAKKADLFELMADAVVGELPLPALTGDWLEDLRAYALRERALLRLHPWYLTLPRSRPAFGPNTLRAMEHSLAIVEGLGLDIDDMLVIVSTVVALVHGYVMNELSEQRAAVGSGLDNDEWMAMRSPYAESIIASGDYPLVARVILDAAGPHAPDREERAFLLGLDQLLRGLQASAAAPQDG